MEQYSDRLREDLFERVIRADWLKISRYRTEDLLSRLADDVKEVANGLLSHIPGIVALLVQVVVAFTALALFEPGLAVAALIMLPTTSLMCLIARKRTGSLRDMLQTLEARYLALLRETLGNLPTMKAFRLEKVSRGKLHAIHQSRMTGVRKNLMVGVAAELILSVTGWGGFILTLLWGAAGLAVGTTTFGSILAYMQLVEKIQRPFASFEGMKPGITGTFSAVKRVMELDSLAEEDNQFTPARLTNTMEEADGEVVFSRLTPVASDDAEKSMEKIDAAGQKIRNFMDAEQSDDNLVAAIAFQHVSCRYGDDEDASNAQMMASS